MAWTTPTSVAAGDPIKASLWNEQVKEQFDEIAPFFGDWTAYTPTFLPRITPGNGTSVGGYVRVGNVVWFYARFTFGSSSAVSGNGPLTVSLPFTQSTTASANLTALYTDTGTGYFPAVVFSGGASATTYTINVAGTYAQANNVSSTVPFTWTTGDTVDLKGTYVAVP